MDQTSAERLIAEIHALPAEELTARMEQARTSTAAEITAQQQAERRERAEQAAARWHA